MCLVVIIFITCYNYGGPTDGTPLNNDSARGSEMKLPLAELNPLHAQHTLKAHIFFNKVQNKSI